MKLQTKPIMYVLDLIGKVSHGLWAWDGGRGWIGVLCVHPICATCVTLACHLYTFSTHAQIHLYPPLQHYVHQISQ